MNSRVENGSCIWNTKEEILRDIAGDTELDAEITAQESEDYVEYCTDSVHRISVPERDSIDRIKNILIADEKVRDYINMDKLAEFVWNCIDVNALAVVRNITLLWNEPAKYRFFIGLTDEDFIEWGCSPARAAMIQELDCEDDEYGYEIGLDGDNELLGITWTEQSSVIINVSALVNTCHELVSRYGGDFWDEFKRSLISTLLHEFRHLVYEVNDFLDKSAIPSMYPKYPEFGRTEFGVEEYGNKECEKLLWNPKARPYIDGLTTDYGREEREPFQHFEF